LRDDDDFTLKLLYAYRCFLTSFHVANPFVSLSLSKFACRLVAMAVLVMVPPATTWAMPIQLPPLLPTLTLILLPTLLLPLLVVPVVVWSISVLQLGH
jgi:hypothetical protein